MYFSNHPSQWVNGNIIVWSWARPSGGMGQVLDPQLDIWEVWIRIQFPRTAQSCLRFRFRLQPGSLRNQFWTHPTSHHCQRCQSQLLICSPISRQSFRFWSNQGNSLLEFVPGKHSAGSNEIIEIQNWSWSKLKIPCSRNIETKHSRSQETKPLNFEAWVSLGNNILPKSFRYFPWF